MLGFMVNPLWEDGSHDQIPLFPAGETSVSGLHTVTLAMPDPKFNLSGTKDCFQECSKEIETASAVGRVN